jgi:hypothetical protein
MIDENEKLPEIIWEYYMKTKFGNSLYIGAIPATNEFKVCSDAEPWFHVPADKFDRVEAQVKFMLEAYDKYLQTKVAAQPEV